MASADLLTITGDGTSSDTYSTIALATVNDLINYPGSTSGGHATVAHVSDPLRGGTFYYYNSNTATGSFTFSGNKITGSTGSFGAAFTEGQIITVTGSAYNNGSYIIKECTGSTITVTQGFKSASAQSANIAIKAYKNTFTFSGNTITVASTLPKFTDKGFKVGQQIQIFDSNGNDGTYTIATGGVSDYTLTLDQSLNSATSIAIIGHKIYPGGTTFTFTDTEINDSASGFGNTLYGFDNDQTITVTANNTNFGTYKIKTVTAGKITIYSVFTSEIISSNVTLADGGTTFPATGKGTGYWQRDYNTAIIPEWFGAFPYKTKLSSPSGAVDSTSAIQAALDAARQTTKFVQLSRAVYYVSQIAVPDEVKFWGIGNGGLDDAPTIIAQLQNVHDDCILFRVSNLGSVVQTSRLQSLLLGNFTLLGNKTNKAGCGINTRDISLPEEDIESHAIAILQFTVDSVYIRNFPQHGLYCRRGGVPAYVKNVNTAFNGGYGIYWKGEGINRNVVFQSIDGDGNTAGAALKLSSNSYGNFYVSSARGEYRSNNDYGSTTYGSVHSQYAQPYVVEIGDMSNDSVVHIASAFGNTGVEDTIGSTLNCTLTKVTADSSLLITSSTKFDIEVGDVVQFTGAGSNLAASTDYYVIINSYSNTSNQFQVSTLPGGQPVAWVSNVTSGCTFQRQVRQTDPDAVILVNTTADSQTPYIKWEGISTYNKSGTGNNSALYDLRNNFRIAEGMRSGEYSPSSSYNSQMNYLTVKTVKTTQVRPSTETSPHSDWVDGLYVVDTNGHSYTGFNWQSDISVVGTIKLNNNRGFQIGSALNTGNLYIRSLHTTDDTWRLIITSPIINTAATSALSLSSLNSTYQYARKGTVVICKNITPSPIRYEKIDDTTSSGAWISTAVTLV